MTHHDPSWCIMTHHDTRFLRWFYLILLFFLFPSFFAGELALRGGDLAASATNIATDLVAGLRCLAPCSRSVHSIIELNWLWCQSLWFLKLYVKKYVYIYNIIYIYMIYIYIYVYMYEIYIYIYNNYSQAKSVKNQEFGELLAPGRRWSRNRKP